MIKSFLVAVQFLTCIPVTIKGEIKPEDNGHALLFYPLVGLIIGTILYLLSNLFEPSGISAAIILTVWIILTGALHLDGLADSADAWMGGHANPDRILTIMKDPTAGPIAVIALILVLLLKWTALQSLVTTNSMLIIFSPIIARAMVVVLIMKTPYVRRNGIGADIRKYLSSKTAFRILIGFMFFLLLIDWGAALLAIAGGIIITLFLRHMMIKKINGFTGDTAGALIELVELGVLLLLLMIE